jgi:hypothetical protein
MVNPVHKLPMHAVYGRTGKAIGQGLLNIGQGECTNYFFPDTALSRIKQGTCRSELARDSFSWPTKRPPELTLSRASSLLQECISIQ